MADTYTPEELEAWETYSYGKAFYRGREIKEAFIAGYRVRTQ